MAETKTYVYADKTGTKRFAIFHRRGTYSFEHPYEEKCDDCPGRKDG